VTTPTSSPPPPAGAPSRSLAVLLGDQRATIVELLRRCGEASVAELSERLGISAVATRRHLAVLEADELVAARTVRQARGRPAARYHLTEAAGRLFPQRYDRFAAEALDFLTDEHGRDGLRAFLRWRLEREVAGLREAVTAPDLPGRLEQLADALSAAGFEASVTNDGDGFTLTQQHCALEEVAREHPELCAYEAATFSKVLGRDVTLSRRETLTAGATACVCSIRSRSAARTVTHARTDAAPPEAGVATATRGDPAVSATGSERGPTAASSDDSDPPRTSSTTTDRTTTIATTDHRSSATASDGSTAAVTDLSTTPAITAAGRGEPR
jgi:predicted ArsR family transcriptional regulator